MVRKLLYHVVLQEPFPGPCCTYGAACWAAGHRFCTAPSIHASLQPIALHPHHAPPRHQSHLRNTTREPTMMTNPLTPLSKSWSAPTRCSSTWRWPSAPPLTRPSVTTWKGKQSQKWHACAACFAYSGIMPCNNVLQNTRSTYTASKLDTASNLVGMLFTSRVCCKSPHPLATNSHRPACPSK